MTCARRPFLLTLLLLAIALRTTLGAPCCMEPVAGYGAGGHAGHHSAGLHHDAQESQALHQRGSDQDSDQGGDQGGDNTTNPCCSACGPTLAPDPVQFTARSAPATLAQPEPIRALATRPPFPAYDARGPPVAV